MQWGPAYAVRARRGTGATSGHRAGAGGRLGRANQSDFSLFYANGRAQFRRRLSARRSGKRKRADPEAGPRFLSTVLSKEAYLMRVTWRVAWKVSPSARYRYSPLGSPPPSMATSRTCPASTTPSKSTATSRPKTS